MKIMRPPGLTLENMCFDETGLRLDDVLQPVCWFPSKKTRTQLWNNSDRLGSTYLGVVLAPSRNLHEGQASFFLCTRTPGHCVYTTHNLVGPGLSC